jgi:hypothetical protein
MKRKWKLWVKNGNRGETLNWPKKRSSKKTGNRKSITKKGDDRKKVTWKTNKWGGCFMKVETGAVKWGDC